MTSKKAILAEPISNRNSKFFASMVSVSKRFARLVGRPPTTQEEKWVDTLRHLENFNHCYASFEVYGSPFYFDVFRLSFNDVMLLMNRIHVHDGYRFNDLAVEDPVVMDIGAHIGVFPRFVLGKKPKSTLYALEPDRENFSLLTINLENFQSASCFQKGVFTKKDSIEFFTSKKIDWRSTLMVNQNFKNRSEFEPNEFTTSYKVEVTDIDSFVAEASIKRLDFLKMTVPGQIEPVVLDGAIQTITEFRPQIGLYVYSDNGQAVEEFFNRVGGYDEVPSPYILPVNSFAAFRIFQPS